MPSMSTVAGSDHAFFPFYTQRDALSALPFSSPGMQLHHHLFPLQNTVAKPSSNLPQSSFSDNDHPASPSVSKTPSYTTSLTSPQETTALSDNRSSLSAPQANVTYPPELTSGPVPLNTLERKNNLQVALAEPRNPESRSYQAHYPQATKILVCGVGFCRESFTSPSALDRHRLSHRSSQALSAFDLQEEQLHRFSWMSTSMKNEASPDNINGTTVHSAETHQPSTGSEVVGAGQGTANPKPLTPQTHVTETRTAPPEFQCHHQDCLRTFHRKTSLTNHLKAHQNVRSRSIYRTKRARKRAAAAARQAAVTAAVENNLLAQAAQSSALGRVHPSALSTSKLWCSISTPGETYNPHNAFHPRVPSPMGTLDQHGQPSGVTSHTDITRPADTPNDTISSEYPPSMQRETQGGGLTVQPSGSPTSQAQPVPVDHGFQLDMGVNIAPSWNPSVRMGAEHYSTLPSDALRYEEGHRTSAVPDIPLLPEDTLRSLPIPDLTCESLPMGNDSQFLVDNIEALRNYGLLDDVHIAE